MLLYQDCILGPIISYTINTILLNTAMRNVTNSYPSFKKKIVPFFLDRWSILLQGRLLKDYLYKKKKKIKMIR